MEKLKNKRFLLLGMSGVLLAFGLMFTACEEDSGGTALAPVMTRRR
jgi:hypothetical protein